MVTASATDAEDGNLSSQVQWEDLATAYGTGRVRGTGAAFTFVPNALGVHFLRATITDARGSSASKTVRVTVTGTLPTLATVRLEPDAQSGAGILLSADGLGARYTVTDRKMAIRANQGLLHGFEYFEIHLELALPENVGGGLVIKNGNLNRYSPIDIPQSCSINVLDSIWRNLSYVGSFDKTNRHYGFAVDYRGDHPIVHVIIGGAVVRTIDLPDVTVPIYPMLYGSPTTNPGPAPDETINFGATPFHNAPAAALAAAGVDTTGFQPGWGPHGK